MIDNFVLFGMTKTKVKQPVYDNFIESNLRFYDNQKMGKKFGHRWLEIDLC